MRREGGGGDTHLGIRVIAPEDKEHSNMKRTERLYNIKQGFPPDLNWGAYRDLGDSATHTIPHAKQRTRMWKIHTMDGAYIQL